MNKKETTVIVDGKEIDFTTYLETLKTEKHYCFTETTAKVEIYGYSKLGYALNSILTVCRQALESRELPNQSATNLDYCNLLEIATNLIPHPEFELLDKLTPLSNETR